MSDQHKVWLKQSLRPLFSGSHSHVLPERSGINMRIGDGLSSIDVAFAIDGDELRAVPRKDVRICPREANELLHPTRLIFANANSHLIPRILYVVRFGVCDVDSSEVVKGDSARAPELGPGGRVVALLVEDLDAAVAAISHEYAAVGINGDGVQGAELSGSVASLSPGHEELAAAVVFHHPVVAVFIVAVRDEHVAVGRDRHITRGSKLVRAVALYAGRAKCQEHVASRTELDDLMAPSVARRNTVITHGVSHPDIAVGINVNAMGPDEQAAAEGLHHVAIGVELQDGIQV